MSRATGRHTRPKKLTAKQNVQIFREDQVESLIDYDSQRAQIETGVEKAEESVSIDPILAAPCFTSYPIFCNPVTVLFTRLVTHLFLAKYLTSIGIPSSTSNQSIRSC
jgi:hypothetical protein